MGYLKMADGVFQAGYHRWQGSHWDTFGALQQFVNVSSEAVQEFLSLRIDGFSLLDLGVKLFQKLAKFFIVHKKHLSASSSSASAHLCHHVRIPEKKVQTPINENGRPIKINTITAAYCPQTPGS